MMSTLHIYTRVSTASQEDKGTSLQSQEELGIKKAEELGFDPRLWNEGGASSHYEDLENRPVLQRLLIGIERLEIEHLFVFNTDRLSRNQRVWGTIRWKLKKFGVKIYTPTGTIDLTSPTDELMFGILSEISQYDNALRAERSRLGKLNKVRMGFWMGGPPPYGYKIKDRKLVENPDESVWIRKIYGWASTGKATQWIKDQLDKHGVKTRHGKGLWSLGSIQKILRNTHYIGHYQYSDKKLDETVECQCPVLMKDTLWQRVQAKREATKLRKGQINRTKNFYLLRNLMFCGHCGRPMSGRIKLSKNERHYYCPDKERRWVKDPPADDNKWVRGKGCDMTRSLNIPRTDALVWNGVKRIVSDSTLLKQRAMENFNDPASHKKDLQREKQKQKQLVQRLQKIERLLAQLETDHLLDDTDDSIYRQVRENLHTEKSKIADQLSNSRERLSEMGTQANWMRSISRFHAELEKMDSRPDSIKKQFLEIFVDRIDVSYQHDTKEHELVIKMKLPIVDDEPPEDGGEPVGGFDLEISLPPNDTTPRSHFSQDFGVGPHRCLSRPQRGTPGVAPEWNRGSASQRGRPRAIRSWRRVRLVAPFDPGPNDQIEKSPCRRAR